MYRLRISNITLDSLDVHIGQSYSVLVTANQLDTMDYFMVANPTQSNSSIIGVGVLHYANSTTPTSGPLPVGPNPMDREFSVNQARSISSAERFDPRTISWESVPSMKTSRGGHSVAAFNEKMVLNFKMEQEVYTKEEIDWSYIEYL
ncbi:hypothetical protein IFM89_032690 [Coptis chinensis]|uniref:Plastocyanin-like domain-containing protein n=1 Tax=Coptis chinensis TaxID=261450 RepID=A0A835M2Q2_9MAGN|nr:hypothetical protein IFM89_032690 [Coptis chinensis]